MGHALRTPPSWRLFSTHRVDLPASSSAVVFPLCSFSSSTFPFRKEKKEINEATEATPTASSVDYLRAYALRSAHRGDWESEEAATQEGAQDSVPFMEKEHFALSSSSFPALLAQHSSELRHRMRARMWEVEWARAMIQQYLQPPPLPQEGEEETSFTSPTSYFLCEQSTEAEEEEWEDHMDEKRLQQYYEAYSFYTAKEKEAEVTATATAATKKEPKGLMGWNGSSNEKIQKRDVEEEDDGHRPSRLCETSPLSGVPPPSPSLWFPRISSSSSCKVSLSTVMEVLHRTLQSLQMEFQDRLPHALAWRMKLLTPVLTRTPPERCTTPLRSSPPAVVSSSALLFSGSYYLQDLFTLTQQLHVLVETVLELVITVAASSSSSFPFGGVSMEEGTWVVLPFTTSSRMLHSQNSFAPTTSTSSAWLSSSAAATAEPCLVPPEPSTRRAQKGHGPPMDVDQRKGIEQEQQRNSFPFGSLPFGGLAPLLDVVETVWEGAVDWNAELTNALPYLEGSSSSVVQSYPCLPSPRLLTFTVLAMHRLSSCLGLPLPRCPTTTTTSSSTVSLVRRILFQWSKLSSPLSVASVSSAPAATTGVGRASPTPAHRVSCSPVAHQPRSAPRLSSARFHGAKVPPAPLHPNWLPSSEVLARLPVLVLQTMAFLAGREQDVELVQHLRRVIVALLEKKSSSSPHVTEVHSPITPPFPSYSSSSEGTMNESLVQDARRETVEKAILKEKNISFFFLQRVSQELRWMGRELLAYQARRAEEETKEKEEHQRHPLDVSSSSSVSSVQKEVQRWKRVLFSAAAAVDPPLRSLWRATSTPPLAIASWTREGKEVKAPLSSLEESQCVEEWFWKRWTHHVTTTTTGWATRQRTTSGSQNVNHDTPHVEHSPLPLSSSFAGFSPCLPPFWGSFFPLPSVEVFETLLEECFPVPQVTLARRYSLRNDNEHHASSDPSIPKDRKHSEVKERSPLYELRVEEHETIRDETSSTHKEKERRSLSTPSHVWRRATACMTVATAGVASPTGVHEDHPLFSVFSLLSVPPAVFSDRLRRMVCLLNLYLWEAQQRNNTTTTASSVSSPHHLPPKKEDEKKNGKMVSSSFLDDHRSSMHHQTETIPQGCRTNGSGVAVEQWEWEDVIVAASIIRTGVSSSSFHFSLKETHPPPPTNTDSTRFPPPWTPASGYFGNDSMERISTVQGGTTSSSYGVPFSHQKKHQQEEDEAFLKVNEAYTAPCRMARALWSQPMVPFCLSSASDGMNGASTSFSCGVEGIEDGPSVMGVVEMIFTVYTHLVHTTQPSRAHSEEDGNLPVVVWSSSFCFFFPMATHHVWELLNWCQRVWVVRREDNEELHPIAKKKDKQLLEEENPKMGIHDTTTCLRTETSNTRRPTGRAMDGRLLSSTWWWMHGIRKAGLALLLATDLLDSSASIPYERARKKSSIHPLWRKLLSSPLPFWKRMTAMKGVSPSDANASLWSFSSPPGGSLSCAIAERWAEALLKLLQEHKKVLQVPPLPQKEAPPHEENDRKENGTAGTQATRERRMREVDRKAISSPRSSPWNIPHDPLSFSHRIVLECVDLLVHLSPLLSAFTVGKIIYAQRLTVMVPPCPIKRTNSGEANTKAKEKEEEKNEKNLRKETKERGKKEREKDWQRDPVHRLSLLKPSPVTTTAARSIASLFPPPKAFHLFTNASSSSSFVPMVRAVEFALLSPAQCEALLPHVLPGSLSQVRLLRCIVEWKGPEGAREAWIRSWKWREVPLPVDSPRWSSWLCMAAASITETTNTTTGDAPSITKEKRVASATSMVSVASRIPMTRTTTEERESYPLVHTSGTRSRRRPPHHTHRGHTASPLVCATAEKFLSWEGWMDLPLSLLHDNSDHHVASPFTKREVIKTDTNEEEAYGPSPMTFSSSRVEHQRLYALLNMSWKDAYRMVMEHHSMRTADRPSPSSPTPVGVGAEKWHLVATTSSSTTNTTTSPLFSTSALWKPLHSTRQPTGEKGITGHRSWQVEEQIRIYQREDVGMAGYALRLLLTHPQAWWEVDPAVRRALFRLSIGKPWEEDKEETPPPKQEKAAASAGAPHELSMLSVSSSLFPLLLPRTLDFLHDLLSYTVHHYDLLSRNGLSLYALIQDERNERGLPLFLLTPPSPPLPSSSLSPSMMSFSFSGDFSSLSHLARFLYQRCMEKTSQAQVIATMTLLAQQGKWEEVLKLYKTATAQAVRVFAKEKEILTASTRDGRSTKHRMERRKREKGHLDHDAKHRMEEKKGDTQGMNTEEASLEEEEEEEDFFIPASFFHSSASSDTAATDSSSSTTPTTTTRVTPQMTRPTLRSDPLGVISTSMISSCGWTCWEEWPSALQRVIQQARSHVQPTTTATPTSPPPMTEAAASTVSCATTTITTTAEAKQDETKPDKKTVTKEASCATPITTSTTTTTTTSYATSAVLSSRRLRLREDYLTSRRLFDAFQKGKWKQGLQRLEQAVKEGRLLHEHVSAILAAALRGAMDSASPPHREEEEVKYAAGVDEEEEGEEKESPPFRLVSLTRTAPPLNWEVALHAFFYLSERIRPDVFTVLIAMEACRRGKQWRTALQLLRQAMLTQSSPPPRLISLFLQTALEAKQWPVALRYAKAFQSTRHPEVLHAILQVLASTGRWGELIDLYYAKTVGAEARSRTVVHPSKTKAKKRKSKAKRWRRKQNELHRRIKKHTGGAAAVTPSSTSVTRLDPRRRAEHLRATAAEEEDLSLYTDENQEEEWEHDNEEEEEEEDMVSSSSYSFTYDGGVHCKEESNRLVLLAIQRVGEEYKALSGLIQAIATGMEDVCELSGEVLEHVWCVCQIWVAAAAMESGETTTATTTTTSSFEKSRGTTTTTRNTTTAAEGAAAAIATVMVCSSSSSRGLTTPPSSSSFSSSALPHWRCPALLSHLAVDGGWEGVSISTTIHH